MCSNLVLQCGDDRLCNILLKREDVREFEIVTVRPKVPVGAGVDQLCGNAHLLFDYSNRSFDDQRGTQFPRKIGHFPALALEGEGRGLGDDIQSGHLGQQVDYFTRDAVREVLIGCIFTQIYKWQNSNNRIRGACFGFPW